MYKNVFQIKKKKKRNKYKRLYENNGEKPKTFINHKRYNIAPRITTVCLKGIKTKMDDFITIKHYYCRKQVI